MVSDDPDFERKAADVIGLYLNPPQHAAVFCVDEKTAIQALDRLDPVLPLSRGRTERHGFEYYRHGTLSLYAALDTKTGRVHGKTPARHTSADFVDFLGEVVAQCRPRQEIHIILDNLSAHKTQTVRHFLEAHPQVRLHFTPTYSSWLNQVEIWFAKIERDVIARGVFTSVPDLARKLRRYINAYSANAQPIRWKYSDVTHRIRCNDLSATGHLAAEENWTTAFTLVNKSTATTTARLSLFGDAIDASGNGPLILPFAFPQQTGSSGPLLAASFDRTLPANTSLIVTTAGPQTPPVLEGSAQLAATGSVDGFAIFHLIPGAQEAVVPMETRNASSYLLAFDNTDGVVLAAAVANVSAQAANIGIVIRDDTGSVIGTPGATIALGANGHTAFVVPSQFPVTANKRGTIEFDTPAGGQISMLGIRTTPLTSATWRNSRRPSARSCFLKRRTSAAPLSSMPQPVRRSALSGFARRRPTLTQRCRRW
jgi:transposase